MANDPIWRSSFGAVAGTVDSQFQRLLDCEAVVLAVGLAQTVRRDMAKRSEQASKRVWHVLNLPTSSDINRLFTQLGSVEREIRALEKRFEGGADGPEGALGPGREVMLGATDHRSDGGPRTRPS
jgi:hypothetical protein